MRRRPPRSTQSSSSAASDVYKRQVLSGLSRSNYFVEFSFFEPVYPVGSRIFSVYANASTTPLPGLNNLDIASKVGLNHAYQVTVPVPTIVDAVTGKRRLDLRFNASKLEATICNIRLIAAGQTAAEINVTETRHWSAFPLRFVNRAGQDVQEVILGRFGSRFMINPVPQLLAFRQSPLGTWTEELSELVLAFKAAPDDKFFVSVEYADPKFDADRTPELIASTHPNHIEIIEDTES